MTGDGNSERGSDSPRQTPQTKSVTISNEPETIEPQLDKIESPPLLKQHRASTSGKRLTGRAPATLSNASVASLSSQISQFDLDSPREDTPKPEHESLLHQVAAWLHEERQSRKSRSSHSRQESQSSPKESPISRPRTASQSSSEHHVSLDKLETILSKYAASGKESLSALGLGHLKRASQPRRKQSISQKLKRLSIAASSDTEYQDGDVLVPNVEAVLDNTKTLSYGAGQGDPEKKTKESQNWITFKQEIIRLAHTLRLKGWRRIPIENGSDIDVERLSGALTNAVYVVSPPNILPDESNTEDRPRASRKRPAKLLLRVYGPQVEHLIDRDSELAILRRLSRKRIGPRLLGTFTNGRFEEYLHARALTPEELRDSSTSKQIAKRMRELHDGIDLLEEERDKGPFVFRNWDSWVDRCEQVITWLDKQALSPDPLPSIKNAAWHKRGLVLGVEWPVFRKVVDQARKFLYDYHGGEKGIRRLLIFSHNDTQYGNLLRMTPSGESPLLLPANSHKQLVVIDFEYASANPAAIEFANHFTEWCYNYHHPTHPHRCASTVYPTPEEQRRFLRAYIEHRPVYNLATPTATPKPSSATPSPALGAAQSSSGAAGSSSISAFMLDSRAPPGGFPFPGSQSNYEAEEKAREDEIEKKIQKFMKEARMWRMANSAQWVAWGIVQAKVPEDFEGGKPSQETGEEGVAMTDPLSPEIKQKAEDAKHDRPESRKDEEEHRQSNVVAAEPGSHEHAPEEGEDGGEEFDYLGYAQERAMFFWGDVLAMGLVKEEDLPKELLERVKRLDY